MERLLKRLNSPELQNDQKEATDLYLMPGGRVCVDAGAGTGKTTVLIETVSESILQVSQGKGKDFNPLEKMLVITFGVEASRSLKNKLRERLQDHQAAGGAISEDIWRFIESEAHIQTIDAFMQSLLRKIVTEIGLNPAFELPIALDQDQLVSDIIQNLRTEPENENKWQRLSAAYPTLNYLERPPDELSTMIWETHQKMREFCLNPAKVKSDMITSVKDIIHAGKTPPFTVSDLKDVARILSDGRYQVICQENQQASLIKYAEDVFNYNIQLVIDFTDILLAFDKEYDKFTKEKGLLTYIDIAYLVWKYTMEQGTPEWRESLQKKFDHILVDEFQDTNFVQYQVINSLLLNGSPEQINRIMFIGDVKQSIYQWRSAEPKIFSDLILSLKGKKLDIKYPEGMVHAPLVSNFRSHKHLIDFFNAIATDLFNDKSRGAIAGEIPYERLEPRIDADKERSIPSIHIIANPSVSMLTWVSAEAEQIASIVTEIINGNSGLTVREGNTSQMRQPRAGDIVLLFRRKTYVPTYTRELRSFGISCSIQTDSSLFNEPEVSLVIDFLDWLANPESRDSAVRILRLPIVALNDKTLRYLSQQKFYLQQALDSWDDTLSLPQEDKTRLTNILNFRDDLRWDREGPKASLIERVIDHGCLDCVVLCADNGLQSQANLWMLTEVVQTWEQEELLPYGEFVERLKALRERAGKDKDFPKAVLADEKTTDSIRIMTVHAAKGLEFPIVIIPDLPHVDSNQDKRMIRNRTAGLLLEPKANRQMPPRTSIINATQEQIGWAGMGGQETLLWLSPERRQDGRLTPNSKLNQGLLEDVAEFWRLFYVVVTRARDHLVFSIGDHHHWNMYEWNSWMRYLKAKLQLTDMPQNGEPLYKPVELSGIKFTIGINDLPTGNKHEITQLVRPTPTGAQKEYVSGCPGFLPVSINPSAFPTLIECPRRYQYETLRQISSLRERYLSVRNTESSKPPFSRGGRRISPDEWGKEVHEAFRQWDFSQDIKSDALLTNYIGRFGETAQKEFEKALANFSNIPSGKMAINAAINGNIIEKELPLSAKLNIRPNVPDVLVEGRIDLLFMNESDEWIIVDYKTEEIPSRDSYRYRIHEGQINAYAWLISKTRGIKVNKAYIAYLHPNGQEQEIIPNDKWFEENAKLQLNDLTLDIEGGLKARPTRDPNGACLCCPYTKQVGGPCEY